ncbi:preprotein translocase subunit SecA [Helicobacter pylori]|uniref:preprotein translocase subunit SecA n=1 Tax=Helicobacter pylori TaxID=210 RepID=UPI0009A266EA|nr:preprotein translocase subunit SecA [Helicobacter pylori]NHA56804.1 preprotein translocase subunit SecA [Helicobacter pylori]NHA65026.1 preprotein translocase subunit SecA [Helicobacter pylori]OPG32418.1 preprotein translocase subunit SecA [Helicobacter pylori]
MIKAIIGKIIGTRNDRWIKQYKKKVLAINALEPTYEKMSDVELQNAFEELKNRVQSVEKDLQEKTLLEVLPESFAITREASKRILKMRHFDVQLIGGMVLNDGKIAEMKTGEGKTLVATLAVALNALKGESVYVVTVNDYLAHRDSKEMEPLYHFLGYSVGTITASVRDDDERLEIYSKDIVYGTNNEFGFDYLRDNMKYSLEHKVQKSHAFAIVDEVDSILIDEARTPLIISGPVDRRMENYNKADEVAKSMQVETDFTIDEKNRAILITEEGIKKAENLFGVDNLYKIENAALSHHLDQALKANYLFFIDKDYIVANNEVVIVDEFTGRLSEGRRFSEGLHQALEAKEGVSIKEESQTLADITFQNYFRMFSKLSGMTGTAQTEATEFLEIYNLEVVSIPTNLAIKRKDLNDLIYKSEKEKFDAVILKIKELHDKGQPVLVGTASIEKSETLHALLKKERIPHTVLNAKQHTKEAEIIKDAGLKGAVTIATNMAGRGVDIKLTDEIKELGGLYIIGTERHESRRIDNQLRGRSGRQGDPGVSQFYLSLEDNLLRIFGSDRIKGVMEKLGLKDGEHIESKLVTRAVENAQKKVENLHFESRKHLLEYDDVANEQRKSVYKFRDELLDVNYDIGAKIAENREYALNQIFSRLKAFDHQNLSEEELLGLKNILKEDFNAHVSLEDLKKVAPIENFVAEKLKNDYENKMKVLDSEQRSRIERIVYLQILDNAWREHLYTMDNLKTGINLRGYNQKDPLVEYKKESYNLFLEFIEDIKMEAIKTFSKIQFENDQDSSDAERYLDNFSEEREHESVTYRHEETLDEDLNVAMKAFAKTPKRNEPCPCQSGKKYKDCCAKSGPKKGLFAK